MRSENAIRKCDFAVADFAVACFVNLICQNGNLVAILNAVTMQLPKNKFKPFGYFMELDI